LRELINTLPQAHKFVLEYLIKFFATVSQHQKDNLMSEKNLGIIIGPSILRPVNEENVTIFYQYNYSFI